MTEAKGPQTRLSPVTSRPVTIQGPAGSLEALVDSPGDAAAGRGPEGVSGIAVVCHPHPLHQGTMHNKVVHTLARTFARRGFTAIRFNYRGVGASAGRYADGDGETEDALAVADWALADNPGARLLLAGFSFGGMVAIRAAGQRDAHGLITVAPAIRFFGARFDAPACPWLVVQGEADEIVSAAEVRRWAQALSPRPTIETFAEVGHFFHGSLGDLGAAAERFLESLDSPVGVAAVAAGSQGRC